MSPSTSVIVRLGCEAEGGQHGEERGRERECVREREGERERGGETAIDDPPRVEHIYIGEYIRSMLHTLIVDEDK